MTNWKLYKFSELVNIIGGGTPKTSVAEYWSGSIPWLSVVDFGGDRKTVYTTEKLITEKGLSESSTKLLTKGQIIISARGTVGEIAVLGTDMAFNQSCYGLDAKPDLAINNFLYYLLKYKIASLKSVAHGSVFDTITRQTFEQLEVNLPELSTQRHIAEILSALDDKIELNRRMNQTLEQMAQKLFRQVFVDGINEENQEPISLLDFANLIGGGTPKTSFKEYWDGNTLWVSAKDVTPNDGTFIVETEKKITELGLSKSSAKLIPQFSTIITARGTVGKLCIASAEMTISQSNYALKSKFVNTDFVLFQIVQNQIEELQRNSYGTVFDTITTNTLRDIKITIPAQNKILALEEKLKPLYMKILSNLKENITLSKTRDSLLPKLMSGEIDVMQTKPEELHEPVLS